MNLNHPDSHAVVARARFGTGSTHGQFMLLMTLLLILAGCTNPLARENALQTTDECLARIPESTAVTTVHVQPDDGYKSVVAEMEQSRCTIDLSVYLLTDSAIIDELERAQRRGLRVRVMLEREPYGTFNAPQESFDRLRDLGVEVQWGPEGFQYTHAKYMVIDRQVLVISNQNYTAAGFTRNREFGVVTTVAAQVDQAQAIFDADWNREAIDAVNGPLVVSPGNARSEVLALINSSRVQLWMYAEVLQDEEVTAALDAAADRGVDVRILVNPTTDEEDVTYFLDAMSHGVQIRVLEDPYVHAKLMIVDGSAALIGSHNYTYTSLELNRELGLVVTDVQSLELVTSIYERDWARAIPVDTISLTTPGSTYRMYVQSLGADRRVHAWC